MAENKIYEAELQNRFRLASLLIELGTKTVKEDFESKFQHKSLSYMLNKKQDNIDNYRWGRQGIPKLIHKKQYSLLYPNGKPAQNADGFDLTLLIALYGILGIIPPPSPLTLGPKDSSEAANLLRLRQMRNTLYGHICSMKMSGEEFDYHWQELTSVLGRLGASEEDFEEYKHQSLNPDEKKQIQEKLFLSVEQDINDFKSICQLIHKQWLNDFSLIAGGIEKQIQVKFEHFNETLEHAHKQRDYTECVKTLRQLLTTVEGKNVIYKSLVQNVGEIKSNIVELKETVETGITEIKCNQRSILQSQNEIQTKLASTTEAPVPEKVLIYNDASRSNELFHQFTQSRDAFKILIVNENTDGSNRPQFRELGKAIGFVPWNIIIDLDHNSRKSGLYDSVTRSLRKHSHFRPITYTEAGSVSDTELSAIANDEKSLWILANGCSEVQCPQTIDKFGKAKVPITGLLNGIAKRTEIPKSFLCMTLLQSHLAIELIQKLVDMVTEIIQAADDIISEKHSAYIFVRLQENLTKFSHASSSAKEIHIYCMETSLARTLLDLYPNSQDDVKYYFPCKDGSQAYITKEMWTPFRPFAELFHQSIGHIDFDTMSRQETSDKITGIKQLYHKGSVISSEALYINPTEQIYVKRREITLVIERIKQKIRQPNWADIRRHPLIIRHDPSGGGSTVARVALYQMRSEYPCVLVKEFGEELYNGHGVIYQHAHIPLIVLVDEIDTTPSELRTFRKRLENDQLKVLVIFTEQITKPVFEEDKKIGEQNSNKQNTDSPLYVSNTLAPEDVSGFQSLFKTYGVKIQMPKVFPYGLQAFQERHIRFYSHIATCWQNINKDQQLFLRFACMACRYSTFKPNVKMTMRILGASADDICGDKMYDALGLVSDLVVCDTKCIKLANTCLVTPVMTEACGTEDKVEHLKQFIQDMAEVSKKCIDQEDENVACKLAFNIFIKRRKEINKWWSPFINDMHAQLSPEEVDEDFNMFINIVKHTKMEPHIRALYARYLMYRVPHNENKSVEQCKIAIGLKSGETVQQSQESDCNLLSTYGNLLRERAYRKQKTESIQRLREDIQEAVIAYQMAQKTTENSNSFYNRGRLQYIATTFLGEAKARYFMLLFLLKRVCENNKSKLHEFLMDTSEPFYKCCESEALRVLDDMERLQSLDLLCEDSRYENQQNAARLKFGLLYLHIDTKPGEGIENFIKHLPENASCDIGFLVRSFRNFDNNQNYNSMRYWNQLKKKELKFIVNEIHKRMFVAEHTLRSNYEDIILAMIHLRCGYDEPAEGDAEKVGSLEYAIKCAVEWKKAFKKDYNAHFMHGILTFVHAFETDNEDLMREAVTSLKACSNICKQYKATDGFCKLRFLIGKGVGLERIKPRPDTGTNISEEGLEIFIGRQIRKDKLNVRPFPTIVEAGVKRGINPKFSELYKQQQLFQFNLSFAHEMMWALNISSVELD